MIFNDKNLCASCFTPLGENEAFCTSCGHKEGAELTYPSALPGGSILLGRYVVGKVLGKGGFGITYLAYDTRDNKRVALKEYLPDSLIHRSTGETEVKTTSAKNDESFNKGAERFYEEAQTVSRFNGNPGLVGVFEFFYENSTAYFVMEYLEGIDLKAYMSKTGGLLSEEKVLEVAGSLIDSLIVVHSVGVLHRDISPDNIYMTDDGKIKLIDFGAARQVLGEVSKSLSVVLKQGFAPIEQYQTRGNQGPWTDIYALGATIYHCLTGKNPDPPMDRMDHDTLIPPENISENLKFVLMKMLAVRAASRYQDMMELKKDMQARGLLPGAATNQPLPQPTTSSIPPTHMGTAPVPQGGIPAGVFPYDVTAQQFPQTRQGGQQPLAGTAPYGAPLAPLKGPKNKLPVILGVAAACFVVTIIVVVAVIIASTGGGDPTGRGERSPADDSSLPVGGNLNPGGNQQSPAGGVNPEFDAIVGTWIGNDEYNKVFEIEFNNKGEFYYLSYWGAANRVTDFFIGEGTYTVSGNHIKLVFLRQADYSVSADFFNPPSRSYDESNLILDDAFIIGHDSRGDKFSLEKRQSTKLWSFDRRLPDKSEMNSVLDMYYFLWLPDDIRSLSGDYTGDWDIENERPHGKGTFIVWDFVAEDGMPSEYSGEWVNGDISGEGIMKWLDGTVYEGGFLKNKINGSGTMTFFDGTSERKTRSNEPLGRVLNTGGGAQGDFVNRTGYEVAVVSGRGSELETYILSDIASHKNTEWIYFETPLYTISDSSIKYCDAAFVLMNIGSGFALVENLTVEEYDRNGNFVRYLYNGITLKDGMPSRFSFDYQNGDIDFWSLDDLGTHGFDKDMGVVWVSEVVSWAELCTTDYFEVKHGYSYKAAGHIYLLDCKSDSEAAVIISFYST